MRSRVLLALAFFGSSALAALALFLGLRELLPYEAMDRHTAEERFLAWEGVLWMLGLAMVFLGGAWGLGTLHLWYRRIPHELEIRSYAHDLRPPSPGGSLLPWWVLSTGAVLLALALQARAQLPG
jgi:hypothetical protein